MSTPTLSLYKIDVDLLALIHLREDLATDPEMTPEEIKASTEAIDNQIAVYLPQALANRSDEVANIIRQFEAMDEADAKEMARIRERRQQRTEAREYLERRVLDLMTRADTKRIDGQHVTLFRKKNPASVDVAQPDLVPDPYKRVTVKLSAELWQKITARIFGTDKSESLYNEVLESAVVSQGEPMLTKIKEELKQACPKCNGAVSRDANALPCDLCGGSGKNSVPGCRLREDSQRLEIK
jgi:Siphovirus Gp157